MLLDKPLDSIDESDLNSLIENKVLEGRVSGDIRMNNEIVAAAHFTDS